MDAGGFDVFHDAGDVDALAVGDGVDIDFDGFFQIFINQDGLAVAFADGDFDEVVELVGVVDDFHGSAAEDEAGADDDGETEAFGDFAGFGGVGGHAVGGLAEAELFDHGGELGAVFGPGDAVGAGAEHDDALFLESVGQVQRRLAAELDDDAVGAFAADDGEDVLKRERLEIEAVGGIVVGGDGFGVAVDHDRFVAAVLGGH
jgi:hypothetical protein